MRGYLDYESGDVYCEEHGKYDALGKIVLVLGNERIHYPKLSQPFLEENIDRLELMYLSPCSPNLNLNEGWKWFKEKVIRKNVYAFLKKIAKSPDVIIDRMCIKL